MKRLDKFDLTTAYGVNELCKFIIQQLYPNEQFYNNEIRTTCLFNRLMKEVPTKIVKRYDLYGGDFVKAHDEFEIYCHTHQCGLCPTKEFKHKNGFSESNCFPVWLMEEVEIEDETN